MSYVFILGLIIVMKVLFIVDKYIYSFNTKLKQVSIGLGIITLALLGYNFIYILIVTDVTIPQLVAVIVMYLFMILVEKDVDGIMGKKED